MDRGSSLVSPIAHEDFFCLSSRIAFTARRIDSYAHYVHVRTYIRTYVSMNVRGTWLYLCMSIASTESWKRKIIERAVYIMEGEIREANAERMTENEKFQEVDTEWEYRYDDFFEAEQSLGSEEEKLSEEREWEEERKPRRL